MTKNQSIEDQLRALYRLQLIDSKIDSIKNLQGELPIEIKELEEEIEKFKEKINLKKENELSIEEEIKSKEFLIEESAGLHKKYIEQQKNVRNSREYDSLSKEIEYQDLEIQLAKKNIVALNEKFKNLKEEIKEDKKDLKDLKENLDAKKSELKEISSENIKEEEKLLQISSQLKNQLEAHILKIYEGIRSKVKNKLAVVPIKGNTAEGVYFIIPPQTKVEVASRTKIIYDEYTGRILVDTLLAEEVKAEVENSLL